jgi:hypothetical protein
MSEISSPESSTGAQTAEGPPRPTAAAGPQTGECIPVPGRSPVPPRKRKKRVRLPLRVRWPELSVEQVLEWADRHHARTGRWPTSSSGPVVDAPRENWSALNVTLRCGLRGLPAGLSIARLLALHRGARNRSALPPYSLPQILEWADAHYARTGRWPTPHSGPVAEAPGETWTAVEVALVQGHRGLPGGSSLVALLKEQRDRRSRAALPRLTEEGILAWADAFHARTGRWPMATSGEIPEAPGETWGVVNSALRNGVRGFPGGSSLANLLAARRGVRNRKALPRLDEETILCWAHAHYERTGAWPTRIKQPIPESPGETWAAVDAALSQGCRGLPGGWTLARLLLERRGVEHNLAHPRLTEEEILAWADAYQEHYGRWPTGKSGVVAGAPGDTWKKLDEALRRGSRGLPGGSSVGRLLAERRGARNMTNAPPLTEALILAWADAHYAAHGQYPQVRSGAVEGSAGENWLALDTALRVGCRGLPGGSSLAKLLAGQRGLALPGRGPRVRRAPAAAAPAHPAAPSW